jgi:signal peptidase II
LVGITAYVLFSKTIQPHEYLGFGLIFGGGGANILDRILYGAVIDYFDIQGIPYWHYIFNTADVMIHLGLWSMVFIELFRRKPIHDDSHA